MDSSEFLKPPVKNGPNILERVKKRLPWFNNGASAEKRAPNNEIVFGEKFFPFSNVDESPQDPGYSSEARVLPGYGKITFRAHRVTPVAGQAALEPRYTIRGVIANEGNEDEFSTTIAKAQKKLDFDAHVPSAQVVKSLQPRREGSSLWIEFPDRAKRPDENGNYPQLPIRANELAQTALVAKETFVASQTK